MKGMATCASRSNSRVRPCLWNRSLRSTWLTQVRSDSALQQTTETLRPAGIQFDLEILKEERELVCDFLNPLRSRFISSVPSAGLNAQEHRRRARLCVLES